jgi:hypothetical protein
MLHSVVRGDEIRTETNPWFPGEGRADMTFTAEVDGGVPRGLALLVAAGLFMEILDGTVIAPAAPHIAADFDTTAVAINVAITAYVLTLAMLIPISGWLADRFGSRRRALHASVSRLRCCHEPADAHDDSGAARHGRRDDGPGRATRGVAHHCQG